MTWFLERDGVTLLTCVEDRTQPALPDLGTADLPVCMQKHPARYPMKSHALKFKFLATSNVGAQLIAPVAGDRPPIEGRHVSMDAHGCALRKLRTGQLQDSVEFAKPRSFADARFSSRISVEAAGELPWHNNYFLGNDSTKWAPNCRNYTNITYRDVWDGIDIEWYEENGKLEFDFVVQPGADPSQIRMSCEGLEGELSFDSRGGPPRPPEGFKGQNEFCPTTGKELLLPTSLGELRTALPQVYQISPGGSRSEVDAKFEITNKNEFGITLPNGYQKEHTLRIDPLIYSTYLGGTGNDYPTGIASDGSGGVYVTGRTEAADFPVTTGVIDPSFNGNYDCFVTHLNAPGSQLLYSTYLGGGGDDNSGAIVMDNNGGVIISGQTNGGFPTTTGAFDSIYNGSMSEYFVARLNSTGSQLVYSTYLGGSGLYFLGLIHDGNGGCIVTGCTTNSGFPTTANAFDTSFGGGDFDAFITHLNNTGSQLIYSTLLGGSGDDFGTGIAPDDNGGCFVTGSTSSSDFPVTSGVYDTSYGGNGNCYITHLNNTGSQLLYSTYLGGTGGDDAKAIVNDGNGGVIITGETYSDDFPTTHNAYDSVKVDSFGYECFIAHVNSSGSQLLYSTFLGGIPDPRLGNSSSPTALVSDGNGGCTVLGTTSSSNFPTTTNAYSHVNSGGMDCFITQINASGSQLLYSTYIGGSNGESTAGMISDNNGGVIFTGHTISSIFSTEYYPTTPGAFDTTWSEGSDGFVTYLSFDTTNVVRENHSIPSSISLNQNYPNPFNSSTTISYTIPKSGIVELKLYDLLGREVTTLVNRKQIAGSYRVQFDGKNLSSGTYFIRMKAGDFVKTQKMVLLK